MSDDLKFQEENIDEMKDLVLLSDQFKDNDLMAKIRELDELGREIEVGGQTSYQNKQFVLNEVEFPTGTSGKSRQAVFEACVRIDNLKGLVFEHHKTQGELKIAKAKVMRAEKVLKDLEKENDEIALLEAEGELDIARAEFRQKEIAVEAQKGRAKHLLRSIHDFDSEYRKNEAECQKLGFTVKDWNKMEVEDHYWRTVNDKKVVKAHLYGAAGLPKEIGDSLPLQNQLDVGRIKLIGGHVQNEIQNLVPQQTGSPAQSTPAKPQVNIQGTPERTVPPTSWRIQVNNGGQVANIEVPGQCPFCDKGNCTAKPEIVGACNYMYCTSLGHVVS